MMWSVQVGLCWWKGGKKVRIIAFVQTFVKSMQFCSRKSTRYQMFNN